MEAKISLFKKPGDKLDIININIPELKDEEILIQINQSTICTSDLHTFSGRRNSPSPCTLGHEIIGTIIKNKRSKDSLGNKLQEDDLITSSVYSFDKNDPIAAKGHPQKSTSLFKYGHVKHTEESPLNGGFASHIIIKKNTTICKLPKHLPKEALTQINCTHSTIAGALRIAGEIEGKSILVSGLGMLGLSACAQARESKASKVDAVDISEERGRKSLLFGAHNYHIFPNINEKYDIIIETSGNTKAIENCINKLEIGGTLILVGSVYSQPNISISSEYLVRNLISLKGLHNYTPNDLINATKFIIKYNSKYKFENLVEKQYSFNDINEAFIEASNNNFYRIGLKIKEVED